MFFLLKTKRLSGFTAAVFISGKVGWRSDEMGVEEEEDGAMGGSWAMEEAEGAEYRERPTGALKELA